MSAFEVYLWLTIPPLARALLVISLILGALSGFGYVISSIPKDDEEAALFSRLTKRIFLACALCVVISAPVPSKETIALMYVLPELTSPEFVGAVSDEAKEVYGIAKEALKKMAEGE